MDVDELEEHHIEKEETTISHPRIRAISRIKVIPLDDRMSNGVVISQAKKYESRLSHMPFDIVKHMPKWIQPLL